jgi:hypothetical protein
MLRRSAAALGLVGAVLVIYWNAIPAYWLDDDFQWLVTRWTFHPSDLLDISSRSHFYRPVIELYFWIGSLLFGGSPKAFHLASIALHIVNGGFVYLLASTLGLRRSFAYVAALLFVVQPGYVGAVAWVGAIAETIGACFGCASILALLRFRRAGGWYWQALAVVMFALALLTHESSIVFLPLLVLADWTAGSWRWKWSDVARVYVPFLAVTTAYLIVDLTINSRHYIVTEGQYRIGWHMIRNVFEYIASLYVGERTLLAHGAVAAVLAWALVRGNARARYATAWMVIAMLPFVPFDFGNVSRYLYLPAVGFAMLMAEGASGLEAWLRERWPQAARAVLVGALVLFVGVRFGNFARRGVADAAARMERYRTFITALQQTHPRLEAGAVVTVDAETDKVMPVRFLEAAVQWEYKNPSIRVVVGNR